jgi:hypothetical protein
MAPRVRGDGSFDRCRNSGRRTKLPAIATAWHLTRRTPLNPSHWASRHDPYRNIHKGLRAAMFDTLQRLGRMDCADAAELQATLDQADSLLTLMTAHVRHEDEHVHAAIAARQPGIALRTADDHGDHLETLAALRSRVTGLREAAPAARSQLAHQLYLDLAEFVAENLQHMRIEETQNNQALWTLYSDAEVIALHDRLLASVEPPVMMEALGWMARGLSVPELTELLGEASRKMPPPVFEVVLAQVRRQVESVRWGRVAQGLELAAAA